MNNVLKFPTYNVPLSKAIEIVKYQLGDDSVSIPTKTLSIDQVANMETHDSITKKTLSTICGGCLGITISRRCDDE